MQISLIEEARRQAEICNACRYCEGYCAVFPALHANRSFTDGDITHLANLCHNCRGCYYACQYTEPHEFDLNLPKALAEVRHDSWESFAWPQPAARLFQKSGLAVALATIVGFALIFAILFTVPADKGQGFYAAMSHQIMVAIFVPAFVFPLISLSVSLRRYWRATGGNRVGWATIKNALASTANMKNLAGGHGEGCNFEKEDSFTQARRYAHQAVMYGFLLCFLSTSAGTILHYGFDWPAPYGFWSLPKLLGVPGGLLMVIGTLWLAILKLNAEPKLGDNSAWGGEMGFIVLLFFVAATGLALYWLGKTPLMTTLLAVHLGAVLSFFILTPYTKMAHGFYRVTALMVEFSKRPGKA